MRPAVLALCLFAAALTGAAATMLVRDDGGGAVAQATLPAAAPVAGATDFAPVVRRAAPAVVNIYATRVVAERVGPYADDPFFRDLFGGLAQIQPRVQNSLGSGVIVSGDGLVVSNFHVVGGATDIRVVLNDRREYAADVVLTDEESDLAVLRLRDAPDLPVLPFADSDRAEVGAPVLAIGNPFGVGQTVSSGIVSGVGRSTMSLGAGRGYFLQTDAAINPGNSGGALVDAGGRLLGINTAILTRGGGSNGVGFAIPANLVARVVEQAQSGAARFVRPWAGMTGQAVDMGLAETLDLPAPAGVAITALHAASPLAAAGLVPGDVILSIDGQPVNSPQEVMYRLAVAGPEARITVGYSHRGAPAEAEATLSPPPVLDRAETTVPDDRVLGGLTVARLDPALTDALGLPMEAEGVVALDVAGHAAQAGLRTGDIILAVNGRPVTDPADVASAAEDSRRTWRLDILRDGRSLRLMFRI